MKIFMYNKSVVLCVFFCFEIELVWGRFSFARFMNEEPEKSWIVLAFFTMSVADTDCQTKNAVYL